MKKLGIIALALCLTATPAWADDDDGNRRDHNGGGHQGCRNAEVEDGGYCSDDDMSPSFEDSPVRDSFNFSPQVCLPMAECHFDGGEPEEAQPVLNPACLMPMPHCDPPSRGAQ